MVWNVVQMRMMSSKSTVDGPWKLVMVRRCECCPNVDAKIHCPDEVRMLMLCRWSRWSSLSEWWSRVWSQCRSQSIFVVQNPGHKIRLNRGITKSEVIRRHKSSHLRNKTGSTDKTLLYERHPNKSEHHNNNKASSDERADDTTGEERPLVAQASKQQRLSRRSPQVAWFRLRGRLI
jgi:hypothetical protein